MWKAWEPIALSFLITAFAYYTFEVVGPYADRKQQFEERCEKKGGFVYEPDRSEPICIHRDAIIL